MNVGKLQEYLVEVLKLAHPNSTVQAIGGDIIIETPNDLTVEIIMEAYPSDIMEEDEGYF